MQFVLTSHGVTVFDSGRAVADACRQHDANVTQHRHLHHTHRRHIAVVLVSTSGRRRRVRRRLRRVPRRHPASAALSAGINGAAVDARRRQCPRTEQRPRLPTSRRLPVPVSR